MDEDFVDESDDLSVIYHRAGLSAAYESGRRDGVADLESDPDWMLTVESVRTALERAWEEGVSHARISGCKFLFGNDPCPINPYSDRLQ